MLKMPTALILTVCLLLSSRVEAQLREPPTPSWVYLASAGSVLFFGSIWFLNMHNKATDEDSLHLLKHNAESEIAYLATAAERNAFKKVKTAEALQAFIEEFWKKRDPNPNTQENEARQSYLQRLAHVNAAFPEFRRSGWQTERGRVYLLYGPPDEIRHEPWENFLFYEPTIKAMELWFYYKATTPGEPPNIFAAFNPGMVKFVFADLEGVGVYAQIYSSEVGEKKDVRALRGSARELQRRY